MLRRCINLRSTVWIHFSNNLPQNFYNISTWWHTFNWNILTSIFRCSVLVFPALGFFFSVPAKSSGVGASFFFLPCGTTASDQCTFEHAELNCASCSNSITLASAQVTHWNHAGVDGVIQAAGHFIVYTPPNGDICKKANKNIPAARNAPGISSPTPGYHSLSALGCFYSTVLSQSGYWSCTCEHSPVLLNGWHWQLRSLERKTERERECVCQRAIGFWMRVCREWGPGGDGYWLLLVITGY